MAEEFVDIEQNGDPLGILSKKTVSPKVQEAAPVDSDPLGILKKKSTPVVSSGTPSQLPSQPDFLKQGASLADNSFLKEISKSIPKGPAQPAAPEGKWSNIVQNVFANFEKAGTDLAANALTLVKDLSKNPYIPDVSSAMKEVEKSTGKSVPTPWELDPLGGVIRGLHGNQERMQQVIANNPLPNTFWGKAVSSVASFAPDIAATALLPEAKLSQGASFLAKTGNLLFNNFTKYMIAKEGLAGYGEARKEGKDIGEAALGGVKGAGKGAVTGIELALLGAGSNLATKSIMTQAERIGLTGAKGMAAKELVNLGTDVLAYGVVSPFAHATLEGRPLTGEEIANGTGVAALFRLKGGLENIKSNVELNKAIKETLAMKQGVAISNFVDATPESIVEVYNSKGSADELNLRALEAAKKAKETTDLQKKAQYTAEAGVLGRAAGVKQVADMVINNRDGFAELKASDLPESAKNEFLQKAEEINKLLNPFEKSKTDLDNKIKESEDLFSQLSQQAEQSQDPNERAQLEAQAREAKDSAEKFRNELAEVKFNQNRPDANAGKEPVMEGDVIPTELKVTEEVKPIEEKVNELNKYNRTEKITPDVIDLKYDDNGKEVGGVILGKYGNYLTLDRIYFSPEYRGTGLSKYAYKDALEMAKSQGYEGLMVGGQMTTEYKTKETYKNFSVTNVGDYIGGGVAALFPNIEIRTKDFNPIKDAGQNIKTSFIDFLFDASSPSPINVQMRMNTTISADGNRNADAQGNLVIGNQSVESANSKTGYIIGASTTDPCVITSTNHGLLTGDEILIADVVGMEELNGVGYTVTFLTTDTFSIDEDAALFDEYVEGGYWEQTKQEYFTLTAQYAWHRFFATCFGQYLSLVLTYDTNQMFQISTHRQNFVLNAMKIWYRSGGKNIFGK